MIATPLVDVTVTDYFSALSAGRIVEIPQVNGLHHLYDRAAA